MPFMTTKLCYLVVLKWLRLMFPTDVKHLQRLFYCNVFRVVLHEILHAATSVIRVG